MSCCDMAPRRTVLGLKRVEGGGLGTSNCSPYAHKPFLSTLSYPPLHDIKLKHSNHDICIKVYFSFKSYSTYQIKITPPPRRITSSHFTAPSSPLQLLWRKSLKGVGDLGLPVHLRLSVDLCCRLEGSTLVEEHGADDDCLGAHCLLGVALNGCISLDTWRLGSLPGGGRGGRCSWGL